MKRLFLFSLLIVFGLMNEVRADEPQANCYKFNSPNTPEGMRWIEGDRHQVWCYQKVGLDRDATFIFNADQEVILPELAMLLDREGVITHGSRALDKISIHKVRSEQINPFPVPLDEPTVPSAIAREPFEPIDIELNESQVASAKQVLALLQSTSAETHDLRIYEAAMQTEAVANLKPWRGYWWPFKNLPMGIPMGKYDRAVKNLTGSNPGAVAWERSRHSYSGVNWEGHCNGWAASSILVREPKQSKSYGGYSFSVSDQKGLLAELYFCTVNSFYGSRNRGNGDPRDIYPASFHKVITYYIGQLKKPVILDYRSDSPVDNHVASGYSMSMTQTGSNTFTVTTRLTMHRYDSSRSNTPGTASSYTRTYKYTLIVDSQGRPTGGSWISQNPDFIWVPLGRGKCSSVNPRLNTNTVKSIIGW